MPNTSSEKRRSSDSATPVGPQHRLGWLGIGLLVLSGCAVLGNRGPVDDDVVASRQHTQRGLDAMHRHRWDEAQTWFAEAVDASPVNQRARQHYAEALWQQGLADKAVEQMELAIELGSDPALRVQLGQMYLSRGRLPQALHQADRAIGANTRLGAAWTLRGDVLREQGKPSGALACYHRALGHSETEPRVRLEVARIYWESGRPQRTLSTLQQAQDQFVPGQEPQEALLLQGMALKQLGRYDDAATCLLAARDRGEATAPILLELSEAELLAGRPSNARWAAQEASRMVPDNRETGVLLSRIHEAELRMAAATPAQVPPKARP